MTDGQADAHSQRGSWKSAIAGWAGRTRIGWRAIYWAHQKRDGRVMPHPFDQANGTDTTGSMPAVLIAPEISPGELIFYYGCQPSCLRWAIGTLGAVDGAAFYDLGCGKGRALVVASEFEFREIVGVELSGHLSNVARRNAAVVSSRFPGRPRIRVVEGDAVEAELPPGDLVVYIYHAFGEQTLTKVLANLSAAAERHDITIIYENPVHGHVVDAAPTFSRWSGGRVPCDPDQDGDRDGGADSVVVWRSVGSDHGRHGATPFDIVVTDPGMRAEVVDSPGH